MSSATPMLTTDTLHKTLTCYKILRFELRRKIIWLLALSHGRMPFSNANFNALAGQQIALPTVRTTIRSSTIKVFARRG